MNDAFLVGREQKYLINECQKICLSLKVENIQLQLAVSLQQLSSTPYASINETVM